MFQDVKLRSRAYVAVGRIGKRLPQLFSSDVSLTQALFDALSRVRWHTLFDTLLLLLFSALSRIDPED